MEISKLTSSHNPNLSIKTLSSGVNIRPISLVFICAIFVLCSQLQAKALDNIKQRGEIIIGVKTDYPPYAHLLTIDNLKTDKGPATQAQTHVGLEIDLAQNIADRLGVKLRLVSVKSSNRMQFIVAKEVDILIATLSDRKERRKVVNMVEPAYYASGTNLLAWKSAKLNYWEQLHKKKVCGLKGAFYNHAIKMDFGAKLISYETTDQALLALRQGKCLAFVYDDSFISHTLFDQRWQKHFEMPLNSIKNTPWSIAIHHDEEAIKEVLKEMVIDWHRSGLIIELEQKHGIKVSPFSLKMHTLYNND